MSGASGIDADRLVAAFRAHAGGEPDGVWFAPGRVNVVGEHTDYNGGLALPIAIELGVAVAARRRSDRIVRAWSLQRGAGEAVALDAFVAGDPGGWERYCVAAAWSLDTGAGRGGVGGADLVLDSTVPVGAGLSSSAALEVAVTRAVADLAGIEIDGVALALAAQRAESEGVGVPCGAMDQLASALAREGDALLFDAQAMTVTPVPFELDDDLEVLVLDTRIERSLASSAYAARRRECEEAAAALGVRSLREVSVDDLRRGALRLPVVTRARAEHVVTENARVEEAVAALRRGDRAAIGPLLTASHESLRDRFEVSSTALDVAVDAAVGAGALGARMTGAGFGGCAIALVPLDRADAVHAAVVAAFAEAGLERPAVFAVRASDGVRRLV